jgi:TonB-linked SusC/RagA family outer membrane protein
MVGFWLCADAQNRNITGKITDQQNQQALAGVSINVKGSSVGTSSDASGEFTLVVPSGKNTLTISYVGYEPKEVAVNDHSVINVSLVPGDKALDAVVVTALNIKRNAKSLGYSIATLNGSEVNKVQSPNLINALSGKVAGVDVGNIANGVAGSKRIIIRGASSLTGNNQPLWVIDGIAINSSSLGGLATNAPEGGRDFGDGLTGINPDDIENISVLKGNAAAALYGSRASNGVILVTTKSGKSGQGKINIDVSSSLMADKFIDLTDFQYEYGQNSRVNTNQLPVSAADAFTSDSWGHKLDGTPAPQFDGVERPFSAVKDNYKRFFNVGSTLTNTVALSGSTNNHNYRVSLSDLRNSDLVPNAKFTRTSLNTKTSSQFGKLDLDVVFNYTYEKANNRPFIGGNHDNSFYSLLYLPSNVDIETLKPGYTPDGSEFLFAQGISNPYYVVNKENEVDTKNRLTGSVSLKYQFTDWLYARGRLTRDYYLAKRFQYIPDHNLSASFPGGQFDQRSRDNAENNYELLLGIDPGLKGKFNVNGFLGGNINWRTYTELTAAGNTFVVPGVYTFNNLANKLPSTSEAKQKTNSLFGSVELSYNKYLYLTITGRNDWFSTLPINNNNLFYPAAALSFLFSDAFELPSAISFGKLRASTAQVSGDTNPYQLDLSYALDPLQYRSLSMQAIGTSNIPNKALKPLLSTDYEFGLEMDFFQNRFGFDVGYYNRQTKDDIVTTAVSNTTGYSTAVLNVGKLKNQGIEILLRATPIRGKDFSWNLTTSFSKNDNKVVALGDGTKGAPIQLATSKDGYASLLIVEGQNYGGIYGYTYLRDAKGQKVNDSRGFPLYNSKQDFLGNGVYDKLFGFSNTFSYKNLSLYFLLDGKFGASIYSETNATAYDNGKHKATLIGREGGLVAEGVNASGGENTVLIPVIDISSYYKQIRHIAEEFIYDASFIKMREVSIRYSFPKTLISKAGMTNASISLIARNLATLYKNTENIDPESSVSSGNAQGIERMVYPATRNFGVSLKFGL